jgi:hypothetical protein
MAREFVELSFNGFVELQRAVEDAERVGEGRVGRISQGNAWGSRNACGGGLGRRTGTGVTQVN